MAQKLKQGAEGIVIMLTGLFLLVNSINIPNNPIKQEGMANVLAQAKFVPIVMSAGVLILGAVLFLKQVGGKDKSASLTKAEWTRMGVVLVLTAAYIFAAYMFKFMIPTIVYAFALVFFLNWKARKSWQIVFFAILVIALGLYGMPLLINLKIPML